jgi:hypothetical protein
MLFVTNFGPLLRLPRLNIANGDALFLHKHQKTVHKKPR